MLTSESDDSEWNFIPGSPNIKRNFQEEVEDLSVHIKVQQEESLCGVVVRYSRVEPKVPVQVLLCSFYFVF